eukprot:TRINITY_DN2903_c0_g4_i1.p2 TRINITY_DN2903_c0_g4~~TRINITY_DN2903_c0_g4_i1.p2  ORF type:complete len:369 (-),score=128.84 TRINITY_DN2903_c0_g4_i1:196-1302(-)
MAYDSAIKIINEKRKQFTEILRQRLVDEKRQVDSVKGKISKKIERLSEAMKPLKEAVAKLDQIPYEELYQILLQKNAEFKQIVEESIRSVPETVYACFKDSLKLSDLGSIQYFKAAEMKDFIASKSKSKPTKEEGDRKDKHRLDSKSHRKEKKLNHMDKLFAPEFAGTPSNEDALYLQTSRAKANYYAMNAQQLPTRSNAVLNKQKSSNKDNSTKDLAVFTPKVKEITLPKYAANEFQSKASQGFPEKLTDRILPLNTKSELAGNGSSKRLEPNENSNNESVNRTELDNSEKDVLIQSDLNSEYDRAIQRSTSTSHKQPHNMKYATLNKESVKEMVQSKCSEECLVLDETNHLSQVPKKRHVSVLVTL